MTLILDIGHSEDVAKTKFVGQSFQTLEPQWDRHTDRCSEISGGKVPEIYSNISGNLLITYVNQLFPSPALQSDAVKSVFLTNNSPGLYI